MDKQEEYINGCMKRVIILGDCSVGKTSLFLRFLFKDQHEHFNYSDKEPSLNIHKSFQKGC